MATKKAAKKKAPAKKAAKKKAPAKKVKAVKKAAPKKATGPITDKLTKGQVVASISDTTGLSKKQVGSVMEEFHSMIERSLRRKGAGEFTIPGILKITTKVKPAQKARMGINPFTGQEQMFKAKPASVQVKIRPLKKLKESAQS